MDQRQKGRSKGPVSKRSRVERGQHQKGRPKRANKTTHSLTYSTARFEVISEIVSIWNCDDRSSLAPFNHVLPPRCRVVKVLAEKFLLVLVQCCRNLEPVIVEYRTCFRNTELETWMEYFLLHFEARKHFFGLATTMAQSPQKIIV